MQNIQNRKSVMKREEKKIARNPNTQGLSLLTPWCSLGQTDFQKPSLEKGICSLIYTVKVLHVCLL